MKENLFPGLRATLLGIMLRPVLASSVCAGLSSSEATRALGELGRVRFFVTEKKGISVCVWIIRSSTLLSLNLVLGVVIKEPGEVGISSGRTVGSVVDSKVA